MPAINEARAQLDKAPRSLSDSPESLPDWHAMIAMLLTAQSEWRKPRGVNAKLGFPPKSEHKIQFTSILEALGADSLLLEALIEIKHLPATTRGGDAWQLIVLISSLLPVLQAHLLLIFQRSGQIDHTHVALAAIQALGTDEMPSALAQSLDYQIEHILIDEFQDTSSSQARSWSGSCEAGLNTTLLALPLERYLWSAMRCSPFMGFGMPMWRCF